MISECDPKNNLSVFYEIQSVHIWSLMKSCGDESFHATLHYDNYKN